MGGLGIKRGIRLPDGFTAIDQALLAPSNEFDPAITGFHLSRGCEEGQGEKGAVHGKEGVCGRVKVGPFIGGFMGQFRLLNKLQGYI